MEVGVDMLEGEMEAGAGGRRSAARAVNLRSTYYTVNPGGDLAGTERLLRSELLDDKPEWEVGLAVE